MTHPWQHQQHDDLKPLEAHRAGTGDLLRAQGPWPADPRYDAPSRPFFFLVNQFIEPDMLSRYIQNISERELWWPGAPVMYSNPAS